jgi:molybdopterin converting factor small subunit
MTVKVLLPSVLLDRTKERDIEVDASTVREVIEILNGRYPGFKTDILNDSGTVRASLDIFVNGHGIESMDGLNTSTPDGTEIDIIYAIAGG